MLFRTYVPGGSLRAFVDDFWLYEDYAGEHLRERILPSGTVEMVFNLHEDELRIYRSSDMNECCRFPGALVSGPYAGSFTSDIAEEARIMGVHFKPGGAAALLGLPADELTDAHLDLRWILGAGAAELRERFCALRDPEDRFRLLERVLLERASNASRQPHGAVCAALEMFVKSRGRARVRDVARSVDLSQRRFIELFARDVGLTPKLFARVQRFQYAVASLRGKAKIDWAEFAIELGYFDQSHLIGEFVEFSGLSPSQYVLNLDRLERMGVHVKRHHLPLIA
jgi:AraC-like DNA-binding protein